MQWGAKYVAGGFVVGIRRMNLTVIAWYLSYPLAQVGFVALRGAKPADVELSYLDTGSPSTIHSATKRPAAGANAMPFELNPQAQYKPVAPGTGPSSI